jgi:hypothetical protein
MLPAKEGSLCNDLKKSPSLKMRSSGVRGVPIYRADYKCSHYIAISQLVR